MLDCYRRTVSDCLRLAKRGRLSNPLWLVTIRNTLHGTMKVVLWQPSWTVRRTVTHGFWKLISLCLTPPLPIFDSQKGGYTPNNGRLPHLHNLWLYLTHPRWHNHPHYHYHWYTIALQSILKPSQAHWYHPYTITPDGRVMVPTRPLERGCIYQIYTRIGVCHNIHYGYQWFF